MRCLKSVYNKWFGMSCLMLKTVFYIFWCNLLRVKMSTSVDYLTTLKKKFSFNFNQSRILNVFFVSPKTFVIKNDKILF